jgi:hypothetical protein
MNLLCLNASHRSLILPVIKNAHINALLDHRFYLLHSLVAIVPNANIHCNLVSMVIELFVQRCFQFQLSRGKHEVLTDNGARLTALLWWSVLDFTNAKGHRCPVQLVNYWQHKQ